jgi:hypothetical protein
MFETVNRNIAMPDAAIGAAVILAVPDELDVGRMGRLRATTGQWEDRGAVDGSLTRRRQLIPRYCRSERISATEELGQFPPPALQNRSGPVTPDFYAIAIVTIISHFRTLAPQRNCGIDFLSITQISLVPMRWLPKHLRRSRLGRLRPGGKPGCHHDELVVEKKVPHSNHPCPARRRGASTIELPRNQGLARATPASPADLGRVAIGLGSMLLAHHILVDTLAPSEIAPGARALFAAIPTIETSAFLLPRY